MIELGNEWSHITGDGRNAHVAGVPVVVLVSSEKLQHMACAPEIRVPGSTVVLGSLGQHAVVDALLQEYDLVLQVVLLALVLRQGVAAAEPDQEHHEDALPGRGGSEGHSDDFCHFGHVLLVLDGLAGVLADELQQAVRGKLLEEDDWGEDVLYLGEETMHERALAQAQGYLLYWLLPLLLAE